MRGETKNHPTNPPTSLCLLQQRSIAWRKKKYTPSQREDLLPIISVFIGSYKYLTSKDTLFQNRIPRIVCGAKKILPGSSKGDMLV